MTLRRSITALAAAPWLLAAGHGGTVQGTASCRERVAAPADAVFEATLQDVSRADAPATVLGRDRITPAGNPPYRFAISVDDASLQPRGRYIVRATLSAGGRLLFSTDTAHFVTPGDTTPLALTMVAVVPAPASPDLRASYVGELAAASGRVKWQVDLLPDGSYRLRRTFVDRPEPNRFDDSGRWQMDGPDRRLVLRGTQSAPLYFEQGEHALRQLDSEGRRIEGSAHNQLLLREPQAAPIEPPPRAR